MPNKKTASAITVREAYYGSSSGASKSVCSRLGKQGRCGRIAAELFRIQKTSSRAKEYLGRVSSWSYSRSYRDLAYDRKNEILERLCDLLYADSCGLGWGWGMDTSQWHAKYVLYLDLPQGQVSFHSKKRYLGDDYLGWLGWPGGQRRTDGTILRDGDGPTTAEWQMRSIRWSVAWVAVEEPMNDDYELDHFLQNGNFAHPH